MSVIVIVCTQDAYGKLERHRLVGEFSDKTSGVLALMREFYKTLGARKILSVNVE